jgi:hypothetical protein
MTTPKPTAVRLAASVALASIFSLGAHAFVPTAFGCGTAGGSDCRTGTTGATNTRISLIDQFRILIDVGRVILP